MDQKGFTMRSSGRRMSTLVAGAAVGALLLAGCGGDDDDRSEKEQEVIDALVDEGATEDDAGCFVDALGADRVERFISASDDEVSAEDQAEALEALQECGVELEG